MHPSEAPVIARMQVLIGRWEAAANPQATFLSCYRLMTGNMLAAIERGEFRDPDWVDRLLHHFAEYYFAALEAWERDPRAAPAVWQLAHDATRDPRALPIQNLLLGINAHINYDLVLTMVDLLRPEWPHLTLGQRGERYADYTMVNEVIARTIDSVQDDVIERNMPVMDLLDKLLGPVDEYLVSRLITQWRETVWERTCCLLDARTAQERESLVSATEAAAVKLGLLLGPEGERTGTWRIDA